MNEHRNRPYEFISRVKHAPARVSWYSPDYGYYLYTPTGGRFGFVRYVTKGVHKGMLMVNALYYDEADDPERRFNPKASAKQHRCWLKPDGEHGIEYVPA